MQDVSPLQWALVALQAWGILIAWLTRASEGSRCQSCCQYLFFTTLAVVGISTMLLALTDGMWIFSGVTVTLMVLATTWEAGEREAVVERAFR